MEPGSISGRIGISWKQRFLCPQSLRIADIETFASKRCQGFYVRNPSGYYFTNQTYNVNSTRTGILKTAASSSAEGATGAALYYFLLVQNTTDQFRIYCLGNNNERLYVRQSTNSLSLVSEAEATVFTVSPFPNHAETFRILGSGGYYWNMQGGNNGKGFAAFDNATDTNARIQLEYYTHVDDDPYGLNGATYGIAWRNETVSSAALMSDAVSGGTRLAGVSTLMRPDVLDHEGILLVSENSDITQWTFRAIGEDLYHITTPVDGQTRYLTIRSGVVSLEAEPDPVYSAIRAIPGSGEYATKWRFTVAGYSLNLPGSASDGFNATTGTGARTWMNLVERSVLNDDDFNLYTARKVSVSDTEELQDGQQVVLYTRIWNDTTKRYEFYAVDHNGSLVRCYDTGDNVEWIGSRVNTALWRFTEHTGLDGKPNWYYDLQNVQYGNFIAPQITGAQILSDGPLGINLNGRRYGENYTTVVAWIASMLVFQIGSLLI